MKKEEKEISMAELLRMQIDQDIAMFCTWDAKMQGIMNVSHERSQEKVAQWRKQSARAKIHNYVKNLEEIGKKSVGLDAEVNVYFPIEEYMVLHEQLTSENLLAEGKYFNYASKEIPTWFSVVYAGTKFNIHIKKV